MTETATAFCALFPAVYLRYCRRGSKADTRLTPQMDAVLQHLAMSGPLTVGEMSRHFARAQSVVSEIVDGLVQKKLLERMRDDRDRRRVLVWITDEARGLMAQRSQVLDRELVACAVSQMSRDEREGLIAGMRALVRIAERLPKKRAVARKPE